MTSFPRKSNVSESRKKAVTFIRMTSNRCSNSSGFQAAVFVVLHLPAGATSVLPQILSRAGTLPAAHAVHGDPIRHGQVYVAPPDFHLTLQPGRICVTRGARENGNRPAIDPLFRSAALAFGPRVIGDVLSGLVDDGSVGLREVQR